MGIKGIDKSRLITQSVYYSITLLSLGVAGWALRRAYLFFNKPLAIWITLYTLLAIYVVAAIYFTYRIRRGVHKVAFHSLTLHIAPIIAMIFLCSEISQAEKMYQPLTGKVNIYERSFNDMQSKQKIAATRNGLPIFKSRAEIESQYKKLSKSKKLVEISTNPKYVVRDLTYSAPYVVPKVKDLLDDMAKTFQEKTQSKSRFVITSVLRTEEDIAKLRKVNGNASAASCHCHATTIDISYVRFSKDTLRHRSDYELRLALAQTLHELRKKGRCYVKFERKQFCYHITVI